MRDRKDRKFRRDIYDLLAGYLWKAAFTILAMFFTGLSLNVKVS